MKDFCTMGCNHCHLSADSKKEIEQIKKEAEDKARKKFAEKVLEICLPINSIDYISIKFGIDKLLKEYEG